METELVVFDMDGTLADTSPGILAAFDEVARVLGLPETEHSILYSWIGGSLIDNLQRLYGLDRDTAIEASRMFREYYGREGFLHAELFPGMRETILEIRDRGIAMGVATLKLEEHARTLVEQWGLSDVFVDICGADALGTLTKSDLIDRCMYCAGAGKDGTLMVGDTGNDLMGAAESGVRFLAVTFGYGLVRDVCEKEGIPYAETPSEITRFVRSQSLSTYLRSMTSWTCSMTLL